MAEMTYCISCGNNTIHLSKSPKEFICMVDTVYLNIQLITKEELDILVGYLAVTYPNVTLESQCSSSTFLKCVQVPEHRGHSDEN